MASDCVDFVEIEDLLPDAAWEAWVLHLSLPESLSF